ncbi:hypothetical protein [Nocardioides marmorisolisilvae]|uniref:hypothetical protein n=1 Tax=Nocardioides marmorisolisilvae TaxID=1542737 RepID=UPI0016110C6B|nr:hypothetical protein [Nocardioides marmorisolisilvae]
MVGMIIVVGVVTLCFGIAMVCAEFADRRRSIEVDHDPSRFNAKPPKPLLP